MREQLERNENFTFAYAKFLVRETSWAQKSVPSWTELWRNLQNTLKQHRTLLTSLRALWLGGEPYPSASPIMLPSDFRWPPSTTSPSALTATSKLQVSFEIQCHVSCTSCVVLWYYYGLLKYPRCVNHATIFRSPSPWTIVCPLDEVFECLPQPHFPLELQFSVHMMNLETCMSLLNRKLTVNQISLSY